ncbi:hypothetical protein ACGFYP_02660 [Streptomyces sp. NPDC048370]|uniref:hypothetical protein n=1 Tax=Streptomyces sp. NPDC048370 TaxID=3365540 RepID=UPI003713A923
MRACGWRGGTTYPIDWEQVRREDGPYAYDTSGPYEDWNGHMDEVAAGQIPLPPDVTGALQLLRARQDELMEEQPPAVLRVARELEDVIASSVPVAARIISLEDTPVLEVAEALGAIEKAAGSCLSRYAFPR